jgi:hypothetical protein
MPQGDRLRAAAVSAVAVVLALSLASAASPNAGSTSFYLGKRLEGNLESKMALHGRWWTADCAYDTPGDVVMASTRDWINAFLWDGHRNGFARRVRPGRWAIYLTFRPKRPYALAIQRSANRWDVARRGRVIGHTVGPDGAAAAAALLTVCA